jgi:hypothetical protein
VAIQIYNASKARVTHDGRVVALVLAEEWDGNHGWSRGNDKRMVASLARIGLPSLGEDES